MKTTLMILTIALGLISCGKDNSTGGDNNGSTNNGVSSQQVYTQFASSASNPELVDDNLGVFAIEIMRNGTFDLYKEEPGGRLGLLLSSSWTVNGTNIVLNGLGSGTYLDSTQQGVKFDCIAMNSNTYGPAVVQQLRIAGKSANAYISFCKRR